MRYIIQRRQHSEEEDEDLAASIEKLKTELQQSADTIIKRLGSHVTKLEGLLRDADDRRVRLETRVADAQRLEWALRQRIEELERRLRDLGQNSSVPQPVQQAPQQPPAPQVVPAMEFPVQTTEAQRTDGDEFAAVLHQSMMREQTRARIEMPAAPSYVPVQPVRVTMQQPTPSASLRAEQLPQRDGAALAAAMQVMPSSATAQPHASSAPVQSASMPVQEANDVPQEDEAIIKARALLRAGRTIEQVARETGVEIGALRLMKQMTQKD